MNKDLKGNLIKMADQADDPTAASRKRDHIELAFRSQVQSSGLDQRFYYEPLLAGHPQRGSYPRQHFLGKPFKVPIWVSSMTGGTAMAWKLLQIRMPMEFQTLRM